MLKQRGFFGPNIPRIGIIIVKYIFTYTYQKKYIFTSVTIFSYEKHISVITVVKIYSELLNNDVMMIYLSAMEICNQVCIKT